MIRKIQASDKQEYLKMATDFYNSDAVIAPVPAENLENTFNEAMRSSEYVECYIIESGGQTAGFALLAKTFSQECGGMVTWIEELYIKPQFRGHGIGKEFFAFLQSSLSEGVKRFRLETEPENSGAIRLYKSLGFRPLEYIQFIKGM